MSPSYDVYEASEHKCEIREGIDHHVLTTEENLFILIPVYDRVVLDYEDYIGGPQSQSYEEESHSQ